MNPKLVFLLLASVIGPMTCSAVDNATAQVGIPEPQAVPHKNTTAQVGIPEPGIHGPHENTSTTTDKPKTSTTPLPSTTSTTIKTTTISPSTTSTTSAPPTTSTPTPTSTTTPHPSSTTEKPHPSDRKFDAFSFIGGFALAIGLVAIGFLAWKLYISRRGDMYHTL